MRPTQGVVLAVLSAMVAVAVAIAVPAIGANGNDKGLSKHDRALLAEAKAEGKSIGHRPRRGEGRRGERRDPGARGARGNDPVPRCGARLHPREHRARQGRAGGPARERRSARRGRDGRVPDPRPEGVVGIIGQPTPGAATPRVNPYMPTQDTGAAQFVNANPTWDGRNVTIGIVDSGVSLDHPSLLTTSTGQPQDRRLGHGHRSRHRRRPDVGQHGGPGERARRSRSERRRPTPRRLRDRTASACSTRATRASAARSAATSTETATRPARAALRHPLGHRQPIRSGSTPNQNNSFADQTAMRDYKVNRDVGYFGTDNPATAVAERMPFVVQTEGNIKYVNIGIVSGAHGSHVAGIAAGNALFGGADERRSAGREDRLVARMPVHRGLHGARADRGHDLRRQAVERRRDQHVDRRPAGAQRRQQRALRALQAPDRAVERPDVHLGRQQRARA